MGQSVNKPKWGAKRQCQECGARFYDLKRSKVVCPKCHAPFKMAAPPRARRAIATPAKAKAAAPLDKPVEKTDQPPESAEDKAIKEFDVCVPEDPGDGKDDGDDKDEDAFEDVSELGEDEDDMAEVIDGSRKVGES